MANTKNPSRSTDAGEGAAPKPDLVFGFVAPIGTDLLRVNDNLSAFLKQVGYQPHNVRLSDWFNIDKQKKAKLSGKKLYSKLMNFGDHLRRTAARNDAVAALAVAAINRIRNTVGQGDARPPFAAILRQFKTPEEIQSLRGVYGNRLIVISCHSSHGRRVESLSSKLAAHSHQLHVARFRHQAEALIMRDEEDYSRNWGQNVRKAFPLGDMFVDVDDNERLSLDFRRMLEILFKHPHRTPTRDEYGMYLAEAADLRSAALGRQVGAVIATARGDVVSVGSNEVPRAGGGQYWEGEVPDRRDHTLGFDTNDRFKEKLLAEIMRRLCGAKWIRRKIQNEGLDVLVSKLLYTDDAVLAGAQVDNIIEFGRCVHAEMAAIVDAARRGVSVDEAVLFTSTFPCHECARHIVAAGVKRVVYRLPYAKSLVRELYPDSIDIDGTCGDIGRVLFEPYVGIAPRRYGQFFTMLSRKDPMGNVSGWSPMEASPNMGEYYPPEDLVVADETVFFNDVLAKWEEHENGTVAN